MGLLTPRRNGRPARILHPGPGQDGGPDCSLYAPDEVLGGPDTLTEDLGERATRSYVDPPTGAVYAVGLPVLETLRNLVLWKINGVDKLSFLAVNGVGEMFR